MGTNLEATAAVGLHAILVLMCHSGQASQTCFVLLQINEEGPAKSRARRWARVLEKNSYSWPEVLRRYLLATRAKTGIPQPQLLQPDTHLSLLPDNVAAVKGALELANKPWWRCTIFSCFVHCVS